MSKLTNGIGKAISQGRHQYVINVTSGTVTLSISTDRGTTYQPMTNGAFTASEDGILISSDVFIKADITGTATVDIAHIGG